MPAYRNLSGRSGVISYEVTFDERTGEPIELLVTFRSGRHRNYVYTPASCGRANFARLVSLAEAGRGLNSLITRVIKGGYARRY